MKILCTTFLLFFNLSHALAETIPVEYIRIGIESEAVDQEQKAFVESTFESLSTELEKNQRLFVQFLTTEDLIDAIARNRVHLFVASSVTYRQSILSGTRDIAVLTFQRAREPNRNEGGLILTRMANQSIQNWTDLQNKSVVAAGTISPTVEMSLKNEMLKFTENPMSVKIFDNMKRGKAEQVLEDLKQGRTDAVVFPICLLERLSEKNSNISNEFAVLTPKQDQKLACLHSTALFPNLTIAAMPSLSSSAYLKVFRSLLSMDEKKHQYAWAIATDFSTLDVALHGLGADAWVSYREPSWAKFFHRYWSWFVGVVITFLLIVGNSALLGWLVRRRTRELIEALEKQKVLERAADRSRTQLEKMRRLHTLGQLASLFAHELRQPLNAISCYAHGIHKAVDEADEKVKTKVAGGVQALEGQVQRMSAVVERVRDYVRSQSTRNKECLLSKLVEAAIENFSMTSVGNIPVKFSVEKEKETDIRADAMEMELIVVNLLRNAAQAQENEKNPWIDVHVEGGDKIVAINVTDNGPPLSTEALSNIVSAGESTKPEGLGLGLSIVRDLVEAHRGFIHYGLSRSGSLRVEIVFPRAGHEL